MKIFYFCVGFYLFLMGTCAFAVGETLYQEGVGFYQQQQYDKAVLSFQGAVKSDPKDWKSYQMLGTCFFYQHKNSEASSAFAESLRLHPDNEPVKKFLEKSQLSVIASAAPSVSAPPAAISSAIKKNVNPTLDANPVFLKLVNFGISYDMYLDDLNKAQDAFVSAASSGQTVHTVVKSNYAIETQFELGYAFDSENGASVNFSIVGPGMGYYFSSSYGDLGGVFQGVSGNFRGKSLWMYIYPISLDLKYYRYFPDNNGRWFASAGIGYVSVLAKYNFLDTTGDYPALASDNNNLTGNAIGFTLGFGREIPLVWILGLEIGVQARYANVSKVTSGYSGGSGTQTLGTTSDGAIGLVDVNAIGGGIQFRSIDFSGVKANAGINLYF